ncbi:MAG TPA: hypothetical protein P5149_06765 [Candidatus Competibacteraceae bacterium]|nr:hypothetical protein [Gammaproteobacteria bacterium]HPF59533.1 hypothetical protein [Candidatus Competibacteraceae bacterium]HRY18093.1 hypothetical protein [Candidatus Competibacteraceae bacterium]
MRKSLFLLAFFILLPAWAGIPATPVMTLYQFNGNLEIPYYDLRSFEKSGASRPAGSLAQGTSLIPCLVVRNGRPLTDRQGTPYVGFRIVVNSRAAVPASTAVFKTALKQRQAMSAANHHCDAAVQYVMNVRKMYAMEKAPFFDPPFLARINHATPKRPYQNELDQIIQAFHNSSYCAAANHRLIGRRHTLQQAWDRFIGAQRNQWPRQILQRAKHLDYVMRTAIFEGHLDRGCNAYGACERNIIALSIRNRARESCSKGQGCRFQGDFQGVSSKVSQYNIWDEYLTQISGLTSCFLRQDLGSDSSVMGGRDDYNVAYYDKIQAMYRQNLPDIQRILFGKDHDLQAVFPNVSLKRLKKLRHYYHAPAMGQCFPHHNRVEYMSGAIARKGQDFALIANTRIRVDQRHQEGYFFQDFVVQQQPDKDVVSLIDRYPGFIVDGRKVSLRTASGCPPYGIPRGCRFNTIGRYRKTPSWLKSGTPLALTCRICDRGEQCKGRGSLQEVTIGGVCDTQMRPVAAVD